MRKPSVAIVGRANVGKSSLFNALIGQRQAIVDSVPGVTRDRVFATAEWYGKVFDLIDTGGFEPFMQEGYKPLIREQAELAIEEADVIIFLCDVKSGVTADDKEIAGILRKANKPVVVAVNKMEQRDDEFYTFYELGLGEIYPISAMHRTGLAELMTEVLKELPEAPEGAEFEGIRFALIGKPNVGKSTLFNHLLGTERAIVSDEAGTTRDALTEIFEYEGERYAVIDTAGLRRKARVADSVEKYSAMRSLNAVENCDVALIMIDATEGVTEQDTKVAGLAHNAGKASCFLINKADSLKESGGKREEIIRQVKTKFAYMSYAPMLFVSAKTGENVERIFPLIKEIYENNCRRISTGLLNEVLGEAILRQPPPQDKGRQLKIYYGTQIKTQPPSIVFFCNDKKLSHFSYERFLENQLRQAFDFSGTPVVITLRGKHDLGMFKEE
ncbi:MAG: ribosome biogenesis GTPase Der [Eubacteriales bacterium]|nr:ribosome biogenesis GTPase Der [Eubacteriales bacterium]